MRDKVQKIRMLGHVKRKDDESGENQKLETDCG